MVPVELKPLLGRLDRVCTRAVEGAAGLCISRSQYEVTVEHVMLRLLDDPTSDARLVLAAFEVDLGRLARSLTGALDELRIGNAGKPVLSPLLVEWIEDAWMVASIDQGLTTIRSGSMIVALALRPRRYLASDHPELAKLRAEELRRTLHELVARSSEEDASGGGVAAEQRAPKADSALARFASNLTALARAGKIDPVLGRDRELRQTIDILTRRRKNNPIIVGEAGVGKTAVVEGLALRIAEGDVPEMLRGVDILGLDLGLLQAGAGVKGEFESRLKAVIDEVKAAAGRTILFIDEAHMLIGAGSAPGGADAANLLKPALARGELRTIAATTWAEYKQYFEEDAALARRFQRVLVDEPSIEDATLMLRGVKSRYEEAHAVTVRDDAIEAAVRLSARYITGRLLPDKAVDVLDTAAARVRVGQSAKPGVVEDLERSIAALEREKRALERDRDGGAEVLASRITGVVEQLAARRRELEGTTLRWKAQLEALKAVTETRAREGATAADRDRALAQLKETQGKEPMVRLEVDPDVVAQIIGDWTGVPVGRMALDEAVAVRDLEARLLARIKGQDHAVHVIAESIRSAKMGMKDPKKPQVFLLVGPSGVGKTELGVTLADLLLGGDRFLVSINMSEYQDREMGVSGLLGAKPGYVGYGKGGTLTEAVRQRPYSVVLLDEIEKACPEVRNLFYQVFDKGELTDGTGRKIDFKNTLVLMTTNLAADVIQGLCADGERPAPDELLLAIVPTLRRALQPAWLARTTVIPFYSLEPAALRAIAEMKLAALARRLLESHHVPLVLDDRVIDELAARSGDVDTGARTIEHLLEGTIHPLLSAELVGRLAGGTSGGALHLGVSEGRFTVRLD